MSLWGIQAGLLGASAESIAISNQTAVDRDLVGTAIAGYRLNSAGTAELTVLPTGAYSALPGEWLVYGTNSDYEARMTYVSGDALTTTPGAGWFVLSTTRTWALNGAAGADHDSINLLEIRRASDGIVLASATIEFSTIGT